MTMRLAGPVGLIRQVCTHRAIRILRVLPLLITVMPVASADARDPETLQYMAGVYGDAINPADKTYRALAYNALDRPSWLPRVLNRLKDNKPDAYVLEQYLLFRRGGKPSFLALVWDPGPMSTGYSRFELYQVHVISERNVRLTFRREYKDTILNMVEPTGHDINSDGTATIFLEYGSGGSGYRGYGLKVFRLARASVDVTPDPAFRPVAAADLDGDGTFEVIASHDRWGQSFQTCGSCGYFVPVIFSWKDGAYLQSCRNYSAYYDRRVQFFKDIIKKYPDENLTEFLEPRIDIYLTLLQLARFSEARDQFETTIAATERRGREWPWKGFPRNDEYVLEIVEDTKRRFAALPAAVRKYSTHPCPLSAYTDAPDRENHGVEPQVVPTK